MPILISDDEDDQMDIPDQIRRTTEYQQITFETVYTYRGDELIHMERIMYINKWLSQH